MFIKRKKEKRQDTSSLQYQIIIECDVLGLYNLVANILRLHTPEYLYRACSLC